MCYNITYVLIILWCRNEYLFGVILWKTNPIKLFSKRKISGLSPTSSRISECVGLNVNDIDFNVNGFTITRKGGARVILYFSDEVADALKAYLKEHSDNKKVPKDEQALFLSMQNKRLSTRAIQNIVQKYSRIVSPLKKISPHKLRSTYGTSLYRETGDIYVVAEVLGHRDVNTTKKHSAAMSDDIRRAAAKKVTLRKDD